MRPFTSQGAAVPDPSSSICPKDVQMGEAPYHSASECVHKTYRPSTEPAEDAIERAIDMMADAKKPIFYVGGGS